MTEPVSAAEAIFLALEDLAPADRDALLQQRCGHDPRLRAEVDAMLEAFPANFHEPYYPSYLREDLKAVFGEAGFEEIAAEPVFLSKLVTARKPSV